MALGFLNIRKANSEISKLLAKIEQLKAEKIAPVAAAPPVITETDAPVIEAAPDPDHDGDQHCEECNGTGKCSACMGVGSMPHNGDAEASAPKSRHAQMESDLGTAKQTIGTLTGQIETLNATVKAKDEEILKLTEAAKNIPASVAQQVQIVQSKIGLNSPPTPPATTTATNGNGTGMSRVLDASRAELDKLGYTRKN